MDENKTKASYLVLTALEEYWEKEGHLVLLGDWCQTHANKMQLETLDYELAPDLWETPGKMEEFDQQCLNLIERLIDVLAIDMNQYHHECHSKEYWKMILIGWTYHYVYEWYGHYLEIYNAIQKYKNIIIPILDYPDAIYPLTQGNIDLVNGKEGEDLDLYHFIVYSRILKGISKERNLDVKVHQMPSYYIRDCNSGSIKGKTNIKSLIKMVYEKIFKKSPILCVGSHGDLLLQNMGTVCFAQMKTLDPNIKQSVAYDLLKRKSFQINFQPTNEFERVLLENIAYDLPMVVLEQYKLLSEFRDKYFKFQPQIVILPGGLSTDESVYWARWYEQGVKFYFTAHSPLDTIYKCNYQEIIYLLNCNKYTWGDSKDLRTRCCPSYKALACNEREGQKEKREGILWCGTGVGRAYRYPDPILPLYRTFRQRAAVEENVMNFFKALDENLRNEILLRQRDSCGYGMTELILDQFPNLRIDSAVREARTVSGQVQRSLHERLKKCRLMICDSIGSSVFYEALAMNVPVIAVEKNLFVDIQNYLYEDVLLYFEELKEAGIWYENGTEAAIFLNHNFDNIEKWWLNPKRQNVRKRILDRFFKVADNWGDWWKQEFKCLCTK